MVLPASPPLASVEIPWVRRRCPLRCFLYMQLVFQNFCYMVSELLQQKSCIITRKAYQKAQSGPNLIQNMMEKVLENKPEKQHSKKKQT